MRSSQSHQLPDEPVAHLDSPHQHQHIENELSDVVPHDGSRRQGAVRNRRRRRGKGRENHTGQHDHTALQTDGGVAFQKGHANAAGGLSCKAGHGNGGDCRRHVELKKPAVDGEDHHQREHPDKERAQQGDGPQRDALQKSYAFNGRYHLAGQGGGRHCRQTGGGHNGGYHALRDVEQRHHQLHPVTDRGLGQHEPDETLEGHLRLLQLGEAAAGLDHAGGKKEDKQSVSNGLEPAVDILNHRPDASALEILRAGADERPDLRELVIPGPKGGIEVVHDPVSASYLPHLLSHPRPTTAAAGGCFACRRISR